jgi:hypothetical protein
MANKIRLSDSFSDVLVKMSEGNPGALNVCMDILNKGAKIDPDCPDPMLLILDLDTMGIYGSKIWMLYKDVCGMNLAKTIAITRAYQLGLLSAQRIHFTIENNGKDIDLDEICSAVGKRLPLFNLSPEI